MEPPATPIEIICDTFLYLIDSQEFDFQVLGMGTALKILFSGKTMGLESTIKADIKADFQLTRTEIVALFNGFSR